MTFAEKLSQLQAFARIDGAILGLLWIGSFACFVGQFSYALCGPLWMLTLVGTPVWVTLRTMRFRDRVLDGVMTFRRAYGYSLFTMFNASLILAAAQFVYFQFMDDGFIVSQYAQLFSTPEVEALLKGYGLTTEMVDETIQLMKDMRPIDLSLQLLYSNIMATMILSLPIALISSRQNRK